MTRTICTLALGAALLAGTAAAGMAQGVNNTGYSRSGSYYGEPQYGTDYRNQGYGKPYGYGGPQSGAYSRNPGYDEENDYREPPSRNPGSRGYTGYEYGATGPGAGPADLGSGTRSAAGDLPPASNLARDRVPPAYDNRYEYYGNSYGYGAPSEPGRVGGYGYGGGYGPGWDRGDGRR